MTRTKEQIEAEIAALQAELANLDVDPLLVEAREICGDIGQSIITGNARTRCELIELGEGDGYYEAEIALAALRRGMELAGHGRKAWPSEAELQEMALQSSCKPEFGHVLAYEAALEMARRIREWLQANAAPEPTEAEDLAMARKLTDDWWATSIVDVAPAINLALAAIKAERRRARGGAA